MVFYFDKVSKLTEKDYKRRSIPIDQYFDEMDIPEEAKTQRKQMATALYDAVAFLFILLPIYAEMDYVDSEMLVEQFKRKYEEAIRETVVIDLVVADRIEKVCKQIVDTTVKNFVKDNENYFTSDDRATLIAENEANSLLNYEEFEEAKLMGYDQKTWKTMEDSKVRKGHVEAEGQTIPIDECFEVDGELLMFPTDDSNGASPENVINCRCSMEYSKSNEE